MIGRRRSKRLPNQQRDVIDPSPGPIADATRENVLKPLELGRGEGDRVVGGINPLQLALENVGRKRTSCRLARRRV